MRKKRGLFIVLEGVDGAGTTTQSRQLVSMLRASGLEARQTHEPSAGEIGEWTRQLLKQKRADVSPFSMALLFAADRYDHVQREIVPLLELGIHVVCDRYMMSSLVYQQVTGVPRKFLLDLHQHALMPDWTFFLRVTPEEAALRRERRGIPADLYEEADFQQKVSDLYERECVLWSQQHGKITQFDGQLQVEELTRCVLQGTEVLLEGSGG